LLLVGGRKPEPEDLLDRCAGEVNLVLRLFTEPFPELPALPVATAASAVALLRWSIEWRSQPLTCGLSDQIVVVSSSNAAATR
jgi:hypothetical protein